MVRPSSSVPFTSLLHLKPVFSLFSSLFLLLPLTFLPPLAGVVLAFVPSCLFVRRLLAYRVSTLGTSSSARLFFGGMMYTRVKILWCFGKGVVESSPTEQETSADYKLVRGQLSAVSPSSTRPTCAQSADVMCRISDVTRRRVVLPSAIMRRVIP